MIDKINQLKAEIEALEAKTPQDVEALRIKYLSKKGAVSELMADFRNVPAEQKRELGQKLNELKNLATDRLNALREALETADNTAADIDLSRTAAPMPLGTRHPLSLVRTPFRCQIKSCSVPNEEVAQEFLNAVDDPGWDGLIQSLERSESLLCLTTIVKALSPVRS